jgi:hypothetical protein
MLNVALISVARARVRSSCICGMAMRVFSSFRRVERPRVEGHPIERQRVEYGGTGAHERVERFA